MNVSQKIRRAFLTEYDQNYQRVYRYIRMRTTREEDAKDLTSDVFISAIEHLEHYDPQKGKFEQWIISIAKNRLIDHWRQRKDVLVEDEMLEQMAGDVNKGLNSRIDLKQILADIPDTDRALVTFHYVDGYSYEEIAKMLNATTSAVRQRSSRIMRRLQQEHAYEKHT